MGKLQSLNLVTYADLASNGKGTGKKQAENCRQYEGVDI